MWRRRRKITVAEALSEVTLKSAMQFREELFELCSCSNEKFGDKMEVQSLIASLRGDEHFMEVDE